MGTYFYKPSGEGQELQINKRLERWREAQRKALGINLGIDAPDLSQEQINEIMRKIK